MVKLSADGSTHGIPVGSIGGGFASQDSQGRVYLGGPGGSDVVWRIDAAGATPVPAFGALHSGKRPEGGPAIGATLNQPSAMAVGSDGSVYVADKGNHRVAKISPNGTISTFANLLVPSRLAVPLSGACLCH